MKFLNKIDGADKLITDANNRLVKDTDISKWNNKAEKTDIPTKLSELTKDINFDERYYTETEVDTKLDGKLDKVEFDDLEIGGRNFFSFNDFNINKFETSYRFAYFYYLQLEPNTKYTASTNDINGKDTTFANVYIYPSKWTGTPNTVNHGVYKGRQKTVISDNEGYVTLVVKHTNNGTDGGSDGLIYEKLQTGETWLQLTKGNKPTDWTPAPEDIQAEIDKKAGKTELPTKLSQLNKDINFDERYYTESEVDNKLNSKVDKVDGKGLSTEDYTTAEKNKLAGIEEGANKYTHPSTHPASMITESTSRRFVSDTEKSTWNSNKITIGKIQPNSGWWFEEID